MGGDLCCGTIFSEMYCSLHGGLARLKVRTHSIGAGIFCGLTGCGGCDCASGCSSGCSCGDCFAEPACGIADCGIAEASCGIADCGMAEASCGIAGAGVIYTEPNCGIADCGCGGGCLGGCAADVSCEPTCGISEAGCGIIEPGCEAIDPGCDFVEPGCGITSVGCSGGCFQDLLSTRRGGCHFGICRPGVLVSLGNFLFGGCGSCCSCGDAVCDGCGGGGEIYYEDAGCGPNGCAARGGGNSRVAGGDRSLKYTIANERTSNEPVYVGRNAPPPAPRQAKQPARSRTAQQPGVRPTSHQAPARSTSRPSASRRPAATRPTPTRASQGPRLHPATEYQSTARESTRPIQPVTYEAPLVEASGDERPTVLFDVE